MRERAFQISHHQHPFASSLSPLLFNERKALLENLGRPDSLILFLCRALAGLTPSQERYSSSWSLCYLLTHLFITFLSTMNKVKILVLVAYLHYPILGLGSSCHTLFLFLVFGPFVVMDISVHCVRNMRWNLHDQRRSPLQRRKQPKPPWQPSLRFDLQLEAMASAPLVSMMPGSRPSRTARTTTRLTRSRRTSRKRPRRSRRRAHQQRPQQLPLQPRLQLQSQ